MSDYDDDDFDVAVAPSLIEMARQLLHAATGSRIDWTAEDLQRTPERFVKMIAELTTANDDWDFTTFPNKGQYSHNQVVVVRDISFTSLCAHHILPFTGHAHIGYIPQDKIAGLSKFARTVRFWSRGLWSQEALTDAIIGYLDEMLEPLGLAVILEAEHTCMTIRGVQSPGSKTLTSAMSGYFLKNDDNPERVAPAREEFFRLIGK